MMDTSLCSQSVWVLNEARTVTDLIDFTLRKKEEQALANSTDRGR